MYSFLPLITGFLGALAHVLSGPDHLAAVTPFAIEEKHKAWKIGLFWGLGHISGMLMIGILFAIFRNYIPIDEVSGYSEFFVGIILIAIGIWAIMKATNSKISTRIFHLHFNDRAYVHSHKGDFHTHDEKRINSKKKVLKNNASAYYVGTIHGFAGIAHFVLFLPVLGFTSSLEIANYLIGFAIGTIVAMVMYAFLLGKISHFFHSSNKSMFRNLRIFSGILAIIVGIYWMVAN